MPRRLASVSRPTLASAIALLLGAGLLLASTAGSEPDLSDTRPRLRIATSGDYAPFSVAGENGEERVDSGWGPDRLQGFDVAVALAFCRETGRRPVPVRFRWPALLADLRAGRFDIAMSGITVRPERSVAGRFSVPVATSGAVALVRGDGPLAGRSAAELDRQDVRIAVNRGGHLERVTRELFPRATILPQASNAAVLPSLRSGRADAAVTDTREAPHWQRSMPGLERIGPFTRDDKAYLLPPDARDLAQELDAWLLARERDGELARLRARYLGEAEPATPAPAVLRAVLSAMRERLALMPGVAEAKRRGGLAVAAVGVEERVLAAAAGDYARAVAALEGARRSVTPAEARAVADVFRAQIEAAKDVQRAVLARQPLAGAPTFDLAAELRPALLRLGERITWLLARLPPRLDGGVVAAATAAALEGVALGEARTAEISRALTALAAARAQASPGSSVEE